MGIQAKPTAAIQESAPHASGTREWTGEIRLPGQVLYAGRAFSSRYDTFAVDDVFKARLFPSAEEVAAWAARLKVPNVTAVRIRDGKVVRPAAAHRSVGA